MQLGMHITTVQFKMQGLHRARTDLLYRAHAYKLSRHITVLDSFLQGQPPETDALLPTRLGCFAARLLQLLWSWMPVVWALSAIPHQLSMQTSVALSGTLSHAEDSPCLGIWAAWPHAQIWFTIISTLMH